uniref:Uncharacterized protein n=1 Tax=Avena sativa TaxID=4498 RepID=A0ACD5U1X3_AVESA
MAPRRPKPKSTGRKKIEIKLIERENARHVSFSKRRKGLFNKATELAIMCGVQVAAVVFSPGGKAFSYGYPTVDSVLNRFQPSGSQVGGGAGERDQALALEELNRQNGELDALLEAEKARNEVATEAWEKVRAEGFQAAAWLDSFVTQMGEEDLVAFEAALEKLQAALGATRADHVLQAAGLTSGGGVETVHQDQQQIMMAMPPPPRFAARMEMVPDLGFGLTSGGAEAVHQDQQQINEMMGMPPPPGFATGMEMMGPLQFGPDGFPL